MIPAQRSAEPDDEPPRTPLSLLLPPYPPPTPPPAPPTPRATACGDGGRRPPCPPSPPIRPATAEACGLGCTQPTPVEVAIMGRDASPGQPAFSDLRMDPPAGVPNPLAGQAGGGAGGMGLGGASPSPVATAVSGGAPQHCASSAQTPPLPRRSRDFDASGNTSLNTSSHQSGCNSFNSVKSSRDDLTEFVGRSGSRKMQNMASPRSVHTMPSPVSSRRKLLQMSGDSHSAGGRAHAHPASKDAASEDVLETTARELGGCFSSKRSSNRSVSIDIPDDHTERRSRMGSSGKSDGHSLRSPLAAPPRMELVGKREEPLSANLSSECEVSCNREALEVLLQSDSIPSDHYERLYLAARERRGTLEIADMTKQLLVDRRTPACLSAQILKVIESHDMRSAAKTLAKAPSEVQRATSEVPPSDCGSGSGLSLAGPDRLTGRSFGVFPPSSRFRQWCAAVALNGTVQVLLTSLILFNTVAFMNLDPMEVKGRKARSTTTTVFLWIDFASNCIFLLDYALKMTALGVFRGKHTLFGREKGWWYALDFLIVLLSFCFAAAQQYQYAIGTLRAFRAVRPLRKVSLGFRAILDSLMQSATILTDSVMLLLFSLLLWGFIGYETFSGTLAHRCVSFDFPDGAWHLHPTQQGWAGDWAGDAWNASTLLGCPGAANSSACHGGLLPAMREATPPLYCLRSRHCPAGMVCVDTARYIFPYKFAHFDNIPSSMLTIFQVLTLASWSDVMVIYTHVAHPAVAYVYFISIVCFIAWLVLNLFVAVINTTFSTIRHQGQHSGFGGVDDFRFLADIWSRITSCLVRGIRSTEEVAVKRMSAVWNDPPEAHNVPHPVHAGARQAPPAYAGDASSPCFRKDSKQQEDNVEPSPTDSARGGPIAFRTAAWDSGGGQSAPASCFSRAVHSKQFEVFINVIILFNLGTQCSKHRGMSESHADFIDTSEYVFVGVFTTEVCVKVAALQSFASYVEDRWNVFDLSLVVVSWMTLFALDTNVAFLRSFRAFRTVRLLQSSSSMRGLVENALSALTPSLNVLVFFLFGMLVFAAVGMQLLGGEASAAHTAATRQNFDTLHEALLTLFIVLTADNWYISLYHYMEDVPAAVAFYIAFYIWAVWIMMSLFVAVVLEAFTVSDDDQRELIRMKRERRVAHRIGVPGDASVRGGPDGGALMQHLQRVKRMMESSLGEQSGRPQGRDTLTEGSCYRDSAVAHACVSPRYILEHNDQPQGAPLKVYHFPEAPLSPAYGQSLASPRTLLEPETCSFSHSQGSKRGILKQGSTAGCSITSPGVVHPATAAEKRVSFAADEPVDEDFPGITMLGEAGGKASLEHLLLQPHSPVKLAAPPEGPPEDRPRVPSGAGIMKPVPHPNTSGNAAADPAAHMPLFEQQAPAADPDNRQDQALGSAPGGGAQPTTAATSTATSLRGDPKGSRYGRDSTSSSNTRGKSLSSVSFGSQGIGSKTQSGSWSDQEKAGSGGVPPTECPGGGGGDKAGGREAAGGVVAGGVQEPPPASSGNAGSGGAASPQHLPRRGSSFGIGGSHRLPPVSGAKLNLTVNVCDLDSSNSSYAAVQQRRFTARELTGGAGEVKSINNFVDPLTFSLLWESDPCPPVVNAARDTRLGGAAATLSASSLRWRRHMALFLLPPNHWMRRGCHRITQHAHFEWFIGCVLLISCAVAVWELYDIGPQDAGPSSERSLVAIAVNHAVLGIFVIEFLMKVIGSGFILGEKSYWSSPWNRFDFILLILMVSAGQTFTTARALRPLRLIRRVERVRNIMHALWKSIPMLLTVSIAAAYVVVLFSLVGMELFLGKLNFCTERWRSQALCVGESENSEGYLVPLVWRRPELHFDDMFSATFTLLQVVSLSSWSDLMFAAVDSTSEGMPPEEGHNRWHALYFIVFIVLGTFFIVSIFTGVIVMSISIEENVDLLTDDQRNWRELRMELQKKRPILHRHPPLSPWRRGVFRVVESVYFSALIGFLLLLYVVLGVCRHVSEPQWLADTAWWTDMVIMAVFACEAVAKIVAYGPRVYFYCHWNKYDFVLAVGNLFCTVVHHSTVGSVSQWFGFLVHFFRIGRLLRLVKRTKGVRFLVETLLSSADSIFHAFVMFCFLLFTWAISGVTLFGNVKFQTHINKDMNFRTFGNALLVLFKLVTLDSWNDTMWDCGVQPPYCTRNDTFDDCGPMPWITQLYFSSYYLLGSCIFYNLLIGIIIDEFAICYSTRYFSIKPPHIEDYVRTWRVEDSRNAGELPRWQVLRLVRSLVSKGNPLGCATKSLEYQLLLFHLELLSVGAQCKSGTQARHIVALSPRRKRSIERSAGSAQMPYKFNTVLLLLANLRVPDSALLESELKLRREIKVKAHYLYMRNKAVATMQTCLTMVRAPKMAIGTAPASGLASQPSSLKNFSLSERATVLSNIRSGMRCCATKMREKRADEEQLRQAASLEDPDTVDYDCDAGETSRDPSAKKHSRRNRVALSVLRSFNP